ncbi:hypothetical protein SEVIR_9G382601v4 [Setaria viridis]
MADDTAAAPLLTSHEAEPAAKVPSIDDIIETHIGGTGAMQLLKAFLVVFARVFSTGSFCSSPCSRRPSRGGTASAPAPATCPARRLRRPRRARSRQVRGRGTGRRRRRWSPSGPSTAPARRSSPCRRRRSSPAAWPAASCSRCSRTPSSGARGCSSWRWRPCRSPARSPPSRRTSGRKLAALRFASGFARSMVGTCALVLSTELVWNRWRNTVNFAAFSCFNLGFLSLPAVAYAFRGASWRSMYLWTSLPCLFYAVLLHFLAQESPRWLLVRGRTQEAVETLRQIAAHNGSGTATATSFSKLNACAAMLEDSGMTSAGGGVFATLRAMLERRWAIRRLATVMAAGFGVGLVYFGMPLNVGSLGSDLYLSVTYNALAELPSAALSWLVIARASRRGSVAALAAVAGGVQPRVRRHPAGRRGGADGRRAGVLLRDEHGVQRHPDLRHRAVPDFPAQLRAGAGAAGHGAGRRGGARPRRARPQEELLVVRRVRPRHRVLRALRCLPAGDEGEELV